MFIWRGILSIRGRVLLLALLPLLSLATMFTPYFSQTANAVTANDVLNRARAWSILNAVIDQRSFISPTISLVDADSCRFFPDNGSVYVGPHTTGNPDDGGDNWGAMTDNTGNANAGLNSVGISGCRDLLEKIGYTSGSGSVLNQPGNFGNVLSANIRKAITVPDAFFGAHIGDDRPGDALSYAILYEDLTTACGWQYRNSFTDNSTQDNKDRNQEASANGHDGSNVGSHYYTYTYENGVAGLNTYYKNGGRNDGVQVGSKTGFASTGANNASTGCAGNTADTIPSKLWDNHHFADAYAALLKPGGQYTPGTCKERYSAQVELDACDAGYLNKNTPGYCQTKYGSTQPQLNACNYGHDTATGGKDAITPPPTSATPGATANTTTCVIEGIGWIICPVVRFISKITDAAYTIVASLLEVQPLATNTGGSGIFTAWSIMRNFANVAFVIFFLVIIFSQLTSVGISNYGIKKMLPKLVVAAILVNISYWICAVAVDISNILGGSLNTLLLNVQKNVGLSLPKSNAFGSGAGWTGLAGGLLAGTLATGAIFFVGLSVLLPMLIVVLATIVTVFIALILRQVLIIMLIVVSPLAFVAYLLPNTESLFKQWLSTLRLMLLMYPIVAFIFGGSALASTIIMASAPDSLPIQIAGAAAAIIPLIAAPALIGGINKVASRFGVPNIGVKLGGLQKRAEGFRDTRKDIATTRRLGRSQGVLGGEGGALGSAGSRRRRVAAWVAGSGTSTGLNTEQKAANAKRALSEAQQNYITGRAGTPETATAAQVAAAGAYAKAIAGPTGNAAKIIASATEVTVKAFNAEVAAEKATMSRLGAPQLESIMKNASGGESHERRAAAAGQLMRAGSDGDIHNALKYLGTATKDANGNFTDKAIRDIQQQVGADMGGRKPISLGAKDLTGLNTGTYSGDFDSKIASRIAGGKLSAEKLATASVDELTAINKYIAANGAAMKTNSSTAGAMKALEDSINDYRSNTLINQPAHEIAEKMDALHGML